MQTGVPFGDSKIVKDFHGICGNVSGHQTEVNKVTSGKCRPMYILSLPQVNVKKSWINTFCIGQITSPFTSKTPHQWVWLSKIRGNTHMQHIIQKHMQHIMILVIVVFSWQPFSFCLFVFENGPYGCIHAERMSSNKHINGLMTIMLFTCGEMILQIINRFVCL